MATVVGEGLDAPRNESLPPLASTRLVPVSEIIQMHEADERGFVGNYAKDEFKAKVDRFVAGYNRLAMGCVCGAYRQ